MSNKLLPYIVYIIECENDLYYIGYTHNFFQRMLSHFKGTGASFTQKHKPIKLAGVLEYDNKEYAMYIERVLHQRQNKNKELFGKLPIQFKKLPPYYIKLMSEVKSFLNYYGRSYHTWSNKTKKLAKELQSYSHFHCLQNSYKKVA